ncbi:MAG: hypothetical protein Q9174_004788 [Haloplaca sp. 1 TL-2023]
MAKTESEDADWVAKDLPDWQHAIYTVDATTNDTLTTPMNKGHEAMAYLTYIIDHYHALPATLAFIHPHRDGFYEAWHTDTPLHSNVEALRTLRIPFVQENGYANLRCNWDPGCKKAHRKNKHITAKVWDEIFGQASQAVLAQGQTDHDDEDSTVKVKDDVPEEVGTGCCAQFAVSRHQVLARPKSDYEVFRNWIFETKKSDAQSGRVLEFLWHVIFGMSPV